MDVDQQVRRPLDRKTILTTVISTLENLVQDWDIDEPIGSDTRVVADLQFESIDLIQMVAALEQTFSIPGMSFVDLLIVDGRYVDDLSVGQIATGVASRIAPGT